MITSLVIIAIVVIILFYFRSKESFGAGMIASGTFGGFMEYGNMYYMVIYANTDETAPLPGRYIKLPSIDPNATYEVALRRHIYLPQEIRPDNYAEIVGNGFRAIPILRAGGDSLTPSDITTIQKYLSHSGKHTWSYDSGDDREIPESWFVKDKKYNKYFNSKIYNMMGGTMPINFI